jgi:hypothetical protein
MPLSAPFSKPATLVHNEAGSQKAAHSLQNSDNGGKQKSVLADKAYWTGLGVDPYLRHPHPLCRCCRKRGCEWGIHRGIGKYRPRCYTCRQRRGKSALPAI